MTLAEHIGARLRQLREDRDLTQADVAGKLDWSPSRYSHVERGVYEPRISTLYKIAGALGVDLALQVIAPATAQWQRDKDAQVAP